MIPAGGIKNIINNMDNSLIPFYDVFNPASRLLFLFNLFFKVVDNVMQPMVEFYLWFPI